MTRRRESRWLVGSRTRTWLPITLLLAMAVALRAPMLDEPLLDAHAFRQTQTAYTALEYHDRGVSLLHPRLPVLGPPFEVPLELPLFQALAAAPMSWGVDPDAATRATALLCFLATAVMLWGVLRRVAGDLVAGVAAAAFLFSPFGLLWGSAALIEYLATAASLAMVWCGVAWRDTGRRRWALLCTGCGVVALTVKVTTGVLWMLPLILYRPPRETHTTRAFVRARLRPDFLAVVGVPAAAALLWTAHADAVKAASPATAWLVSDALWPWTLGTIPQRMELERWLLIVGRIWSHVTGVLGLLLPLAAITAARRPLFWSGIALAVAVPPALFFNLYVVHDYYLAAISPGLAALVGAGAAAAAARLPRVWRSAVVVGVVGGLAVSAWSEASYWTRAFRPEAPEHAFPELAEIRAVTDEDDLIMVEGRDWSPALLYYARRRGYMLATPTTSRAQLATLPGPHRYLVTNELSELSAGLLRKKEWTGVVGRRTYVMGQNRRQVSQGLVQATDEEIDLSGLRSVSGPQVVRCGGASVVRRPTGAALVLVMGDGPPSAVLDPSDGTLAPVPVRRLVVIDAALQREAPHVTLRCAGADEVRIDRVLVTPASDAPVG